MTTAFTATTTIGHPIGAVWERLVDWETVDRWMPGVNAVRAQGPVAPGSTLVFTARGKERLATITALEPGRSITLRSVQAGVTADYTYECVSHDQSTQLGLVADCSNDRSPATARPSHKVRHSESRQRPTRGIRRDLRNHSAWIAQVLQ